MGWLVELGSEVLVGFCGWICGITLGVGSGGGLI